MPRDHFLKLWTEKGIYTCKVSQIELNLKSMGLIFFIVILENFWAIMTISWNKVLMQHVIFQARNYMVYVFNWLNNRIFRLEKIKTVSIGHGQSHLIIHIMSYVNLDRDRFNLVSGQILPVTSFLNSAYHHFSTYFCFGYVVYPPNESNSSYLLHVIFERKLGYGLFLTTNCIFGSSEDLTWPSG